MVELFNSRTFIRNLITGKKLQLFLSDHLKFRKLKVISEFIFRSHCLSHEMLFACFYLCVLCFFRI